MWWPRFRFTPCWYRRGFHLRPSRVALLRPAKYVRLRLKKDMREDMQGQAQTNHVAKGHSQGRRGWTRHDTRVLHEETNSESPWPCC